MDIIPNPLGDTLFSSKLSRSINYYLRTSYTPTRSVEEMLADYIDWSIPYDDELGEHLYLDKQTYQWIIVDGIMMEKVKIAFRERVEKKNQKG